MADKIVAVVSRPPFGRFIALTANGRLLHQAVDRAAGGKIRWQPLSVPPEGHARIVSIALGAGGKLVVVDAAGAIFQQPDDRRPDGWERIDPEGL